MNSRHKLTSELDAVNDATERFIKEYDASMKYPVDLLSSVIQLLDKTTEPLIRRAHLDTILRILADLDRILTQLMSELQRSQLSECKL